MLKYDHIENLKCIDVGFVESCFNLIFFVSYFFLRKLRCVKIFFCRTGRSEGLLHSIHCLLLKRGFYKALSHGFCACSGVLMITFYCVQKLWTVHQTADSCTPSDSQAYSPGQQKLLRGNEHLVLGYVLGIQETFFLRA